MSRLSLLLAMLSLSTPSAAQLAINEVLVDPVGPNAGNQVVELINTTNMPFDPTGWSLCVRFIYPPLPSIVVPAGGIVQVHMGRMGANTTTDWFVPFLTLNDDDELALYSTTSILGFANPAFVEDFVSWGNGAPFGRINEAISAGQWPGPNAHVPLPPEGSTLAWFGSGDGPSAWFADSTPTLGAPNRPARLEPFGMGCAGSAGVPALAQNHLPWLGETYRLDLTSLPPGNGLAVMITSLTETPPQSLAGFGMPGCNAYLTLLLTSVVPTASGAATFALALPASPAFEGVVFLNQALVVDAAAGNPLGAVMSNPVRATAGLR